MENVIESGIEIEMSRERWLIAGETMPDTAIRANAARSWLLGDSQDIATTRDGRSGLGGSGGRRDGPRYLAERPRSAFYRSSRDDEERPRERKGERERGEYDRSGSRRYIERDDYVEDTARNNTRRDNPEPRRFGRYSPQRMPDAPKIVLTSSTPTTRRSPSPTDARGEGDRRRRGRRNRDSAILDPDVDNNDDNDSKRSSRPKPQRLRSALRGSRAADYPDEELEASSKGTTALGRARSVSLRLTALEKSKHDHEAAYGLEWHERPGREAKHAGNGWATGWTMT